MAQKYLIRINKNERSFAFLDEKGKKTLDPWRAAKFATKKEAVAFAKAHGNACCEAVKPNNGWEYCAIRSLNLFCESGAVSAVYREHTINQVGSGRYSTYSADHSADLKKAYAKYGATVKRWGNDAPKGGKLGDYMDFEFSR